LSGFAPLAASAMIERTGMLVAPAAYIAACAALTIVSSFALARASGRPGVIAQPILAEHETPNVWDPAV